MKPLSFLLILIGFCMTVPVVHATTVNMDSAGNYTEGWTDGSNEGGGFEAWSIASDSGAGYAGCGIWDSTNADLLMGEAFGFTATGDGAYITISRDFSTALDDGDVFELDLGLNYNAGEGGSKGFVLYTDDDREIVVINQGNSSNITMNGNTVLTNYGTATMYWTFTQNSATELTVYATGRGGESEKHTEILEFTQDSHIAGIRFFANAITNDVYADYRAVYFNNLTLSQGASSDATFSYKIENSRAIITDIANDTGGALIIPSTLGGYPVTKIARTAGAYCTNITSLSFVDGDAVTSIGVNAFQGCTALQSAAMPDGLAALPDSLFLGCTNLGSVTIPSGVESIGNSVFAGCRALFAVNLPDGLTTLGESVFLNCRNLSSLEIPGDVTEVPGQLCYECRSLASLILPDGTTNIGYRAFYNCRSLEALDIPSSMTSLDDGAFAGCSSLTSLSFEGTLERIGDEVFYDCPQLVSIHFNGGVEVLCDGVFGQNESLTTLCFNCDVPALDTGEDLFIGTDNVRIYYIADPSNWESTLCGVPVAAWAPRLLAVEDVAGALQITMIWDLEGTAYLQACTNLLEGSWHDVDTNSVTDGSCVLYDPDGYSSECRFYRVVIQ